MTLETSNGTYVFFSYARRDRRFRDKLENHLCNLKYRGLITTWHDQEIRAGEEWAQQIDIYLNKARIILLLISDDFMASEYCYGLEMMLALERHERGEAHVIPILLRPVLFRDAPFAKLQMLPTNGKPVVKWSDRDSAFVDIACEIEKIALIYNTKAAQLENLDNLTNIPSRPSIKTKSNKGIFREENISRYVSSREKGTPLLSAAFVVFIASILSFSIIALLQHPTLLSLAVTILLYIGAILLCLALIIGAIVVVLRVIRARQERVRKQQEAAQIEEMVPQVLHDGDHIGIGEHELIFRTYDSPEENIESLNTIAVSFNAAPADDTFRTRQDDNATLATSQDDDFRTQEELEPEISFMPVPAIPFDAMPQEFFERQAQIEQEAVQKLTRLAREVAQELEEQRWHELQEFRAQQGIEVAQEQERQDPEAAQKRRYYEGTLNAYHLATIQNPADSTAFRGIGNVYYALQCYAMAFNAFQQAIRLQPTVAPVWVSIGDIFAKLQQYQQAVEAYEQALAFDATVTLDYEELVRSLMALGRVQEAERYRERARELGYYDE